MSCFPSISRLNQRKPHCRSVMADRRPPSYPQEHPRIRKGRVMPRDDYPDPTYRHSQASDGDRNRCTLLVPDPHGLVPENHSSCWEAGRELVPPPQSHVGLMSLSLDVNSRLQVEPRSETPRSIWGIRSSMDSYCSTRTIQGDVVMTAAAVASCGTSQRRCRAASRRGQPILSGCVE